MNPFELMQGLGPLAEQAKTMIAELPSQLENWTRLQAEQVQLLREINERTLRIEAKLNISEDNPRHVELTDEQKAEMASWPDPGPFPVS